MLMSDETFSHLWTCVCVFDRLQHTLRLLKVFLIRFHSNVKRAQVASTYNTILDINLRENDGLLSIFSSFFFSALCCSHFLLTHCFMYKMMSGGKMCTIFPACVISSIKKKREKMLFHASQCCFYCQCVKCMKRRERERNEIGNEQGGKKRKIQFQDTKIFSYYDYAMPCFMCVCVFE